MSIVLEHLTKRFAGLPVVDDVSLEISSGELFVLLGASGSGKSTILRLIAGLTEPDSGRILLAGRDVSAVPPQHRGTGFVFQNYSIFRHMSVADNVEFGLRIRRQPRAERARRRDELLDLVGMSGFASRYPEELSGGQQQRVALARALAYGPGVLLLDEPFGALDVKTRVQLRRSLREIQQRLRLTMILVTHDQEEAFDVADRVGVIERGRLLEVGVARDLYARPRTLYVGMFLGASNVLVGRVHGGQAVFGPLCLPLPSGRGHAEGGPVQLLVRPEEVTLGLEAPLDPAPVLGRGRVVERAFAGAWNRVRLRLSPVPGTRQIAPVVRLGEEGLLVDALSAAGLALPDADLWVSLRAWHFLEPQQARLLLLDAPHGAGPGHALAAELVERMHAQLTVLVVERDADAAAARGAEVERRLRENGVGGAQVLVRVGDPYRTLLGRQTEMPHALLLLGWDDRRGRRVGPGLPALLDRTPVPLLVAKGTRSAVQHLLICTAAGEPGKSDVRVGGRLAHLLGAAVTLLYVVRDGPPDDLQRAHLERAVAGLHALGVPTELRIQSADSPAAGILAAAREADPDLIVVGNHRPTARTLFGGENVTQQVVAGADRSVLVVPEDAIL